MGRSDPPGVLRIAGWLVDGEAHRLTRDHEERRLEPRVMRVLLRLADDPGRVVSRPDLLADVWGDVFVGDDALSAAVIKLRRAFGDDARCPAVIETVPKSGYRLIATVDDARLGTTAAFAGPAQAHGVGTDETNGAHEPEVGERTTPTNLPRSATTFVGALEALHRRAADLPARRLVTLTGPAGIGKTRMALEVGWLSLGAYPGGVWLVELAPIVDEAVVVAAVAASMSIRPQPGLSMIESIVDWMNGRRVLLILDNCEHVLPAVSALVSSVVAGCDTMTVLATSREPLAVPGERVVPVASLDTPAGVDLFRERARAADDSLRLSPRDDGVIAGICERLDGNPLAIELAAARVRSFTPADLALRLDDRFRLLRGSGRGVAERHQTLRAAVDWSYQLLSDAERTVFDRLSVFPGGFDAAAACEVCADDVFDPDQLVDILVALVDKSMVVANRGERCVRYRLLETLRQFGGEHLERRGGTVRMRDLHLAHYRSQAAAADGYRNGPRQAEADAWFDREWDNIRAAYVWSVASGDVDAADELVNAARGHAMLRMRHEYPEWAERLLATDRPEGASSGTYSAGAIFAALSGDWAKANGLYSRGIERNSDPSTVAMCWQGKATTHLFQGELDEARAAVERAEAAAERTADPTARYWVLWSRVQLTAITDPAAAEEPIARLCELAQLHGAPWMVLGSLNARAAGSLSAGDPTAALAAAREAHALARAIGSVFDEGMAASVLVRSLCAVPDRPLSAECRTLLTRLHDTRSWFAIWPALEVVARRLATSHTELASTVVGHLDAHVTAFGGSVTVRSQALDIVRSHHDGGAWMAEGAAMDRDEVLVHLIEHLPADVVC